MVSANFHLASIILLLFLGHYNNNNIMDSQECLFYVNLTGSILYQTENVNFLFFLCKSTAAQHQNAKNDFIFSRVDEKVNIL